jgi:lipopolysaccharide export system protein LptC
MSENKRNSPRRSLDRLVRKPAPRTYGTGYSRFVKMMRVALPLAALGLFTALVVWPEIDKKITSITPQMKVSAENVKNELVNPRFEGVDDNQQPYTITASRALQSEDLPNVLKLQLPVADITLRGNQWVAAEAKKGLYDQTTRKLELEKEVFLFYDEGYEMTMEKLLVDMKAKKMWSDTEVQGKGPKGSIEAKNMYADLNKNILLFKGPVQLIMKIEISEL